MALLPPEDLAARFPWLRTSDLAGGSLGLADEGWIDPYALLQAFRRKASSLGAKFIADEVTGFDLRDGRVHGARLARAGTTLVIDAPCRLENAPGEARRRAWLEPSEETPTTKA